MAELPSSTSTCASGSCSDVSRVVSDVSTDVSTPKLQRVIAQLRACKLQFEGDKAPGSNGHPTAVHVPEPVLVDLTDSPKKVSPKHRVAECLKQAKKNRMAKESSKKESVEKRSSPPVPCDSSVDDKPKNPYVLPSHVPWFENFVKSYPICSPKLALHL